MAECYMMLFLCSVVIYGYLWLNSLLSLGKNYMTVIEKSNRYNNNYNYFIVIIIIVVVL